MENSEYVTEKEASTKWCSEARIAGDRGPAHNRCYPDRQTSLFDENHSCLGSVCMKWRWSNEVPEPKILAADDQRRSLHP